MIMFEGQVYRALFDRSIEIVADSETISFCEVTFFEDDIIREDISAKSCGKNQFYMLKILGYMNSIFVCSKLAQQKNYKSLDKALKTGQREFKYKDIDGLNWHLHFILNDRKSEKIKEVEGSD